MRESDDTQTLFDEAAEFVLRLHEAGSGAADLEAFERWARRSPEHRAAAAEAQQLWRDIGIIRDIPWPTSTELSGETASETRSYLTKWRPGNVWQGAFVAGALAACAAAVAVILFSPPTANPSFSTDVSEHRLEALSDGSEITIGARSSLQVAFGPAERVVELASGEAFFVVADDPDRPFIVRTGNLLVRAVGTAFNVRKAEAQAVVSVIEGTVRVSNIRSSHGMTEAAPISGSPILGPLSLDRELSVGDQLVLRADEVASLVRLRDFNTATAWRDGRLIFSGEPLRTVISEINRYSEIPIEIADIETEELRFSGTVLRNQVDDWLSGLEFAFPVRVDRTMGDRVIILSADQSGGNGI